MLKVIKIFLVNHFGFSFSETKAFLILLAIMLISLIMMIVLPELLSQSYNNFEEDSKNLEMYLAEMEDNVLAEEEERSLNLQTFDPNTVSEYQLLQMNMPPNVIDNLLKYRLKGGYFNETDQFRKIYGLTDSLYSIIAPYLILEKQNIKEFRVSENELENSSELDEINENQPQLYTNPKKVRKEFSSFDINMADTITLKKIYGVGDVLSQRIVRYREALGGFVRNDQLNEVYGLPPETVDNITQRCFIANEFEPVKIKINFATVAELKRHPYLSYDDAVRLVNYRSQNGPFKDEHDLVKSKVLPEQKLKSITRYLSY